MSAHKHPGPLGSWCAGCRQYLSMRDNAQRRAADAHLASCPEYGAFMAARAAGAAGAAS